MGLDHLQKFTGQSVSAVQPSEKALKHEVRYQCQGLARLKVLRIKPSNLPVFGRSIRCKQFLRLGKVLVVFSTFEP